MSDKHNTPSTLGEAWRSARQSIEMSQETMAARLGISDSYLSLIENNHRQPSIDLLKTISRVTKWKMEDLCPDPEILTEVVESGAE